MTFIRKAQRVIPAYLTLLPRLAIQSFHRLTPRTIQHHQISFSLTPLQQRTTVTSIRSFTSTVTIEHISFTTDICKEIAGALNLPISEVRQSLSRESFADEAEFAAHVYTIFERRLEILNYKRQRHSLPPISPYLIFKQYKIARERVLQNMNDPQKTNLNLSGLNLLALPPELMKCKHLTQLDISNNNLTQIPRNFIELSNLTKIKAQQNKFTSIPYELLSLLPKLVEADFRNNPFTIRSTI